MWAVHSTIPLGHFFFLFPENLARKISRALAYEDGRTFLFLPGLLTLS